MREREVQRSVADLQQEESKLEVNVGNAEGRLDSLRARDISRERQPKNIAVTSGSDMKKVVHYAKTEVRLEYIMKLYFLEIEAYKKLVLEPQLIELATALENWNNLAIEFEIQLLDLHEANEKLSIEVG